MKLILAVVLLFTSFLASTAPHPGRQKHFTQAFDEIRHYEHVLHDYKVVDEASSLYVTRGALTIAFARGVLYDYQHNKATDQQLDKAVADVERYFEDDPKTLKSL